MELKKLGALATFNSGLVLSRKISKEKTAYKYNVLTLKSISSDSYIDHKLTETVFMTEHLKSEYVTHRGDIIIRLSVPYTAALIDTNTEGLVIPSNFIVVRSSKEINTNYLYCLLNTDEIKSDILKNTSGGILGVIKSSYYTELAIQLPNLKTQQQIGNLYLLSKRESQLLKKLTSQKTLYYKSVIKQIQDNLRKGYI